MYMMENMAKISKVIHHVVNDIVGNEELIAIRRQAWDIKDIVYNSTNQKSKKRASGSRREGFCMEGSDVDEMRWWTDHHLICDMSQVKSYDNTTGTVILMEYENAPPGFTLLRLLNKVTPQCDLITQKSSVVHKGDLYISSQKYKENAQRQFAASFDRELHGPCTTGSIGDLEYDTAHCYASKHWPPPAIPWVQRCRETGWPNQTVLDDILQNECHCVALGAKLSSLENLEWRISFAIAEQKLTFTMTHTQFLCYGLLKLFLKEVLNFKLSEDEKLLCSYYLKTAVFWQIQTNIKFLHWSSENFIRCFWMCFTMITHWVYKAYCPNFFIPENNMFFHKVIGAGRERLLHQLYILYGEGPQCLLRSPSINVAIRDVLNPYRARYILFESYVSEIQRDIEIRNNCAIEFPVYESYEISHLLNILEIYLNLLQYVKSSHVQSLMVYQHILHVLQYVAFRYQEQKCENIEIYKQETLSQNLMTVTSQFGCTTDILYLALYQYMDGKYQSVMNTLDSVQLKLIQPYVVYTTLNEEGYTHVMCGKSVVTKYRESWAKDIAIPSFAKVPELEIELSVVSRRIIMSPFILLYFLAILSQYHLGEEENQIQSLVDLQTIVEYDDGFYIKSHMTDIAWEVLGICQQISGCSKMALESFKQSLQQLPCNKITEATKLRIQSLKKKK